MVAQWFMHYATAALPTMLQLHYTAEVLCAWSHKSYLRNLDEA